MPATIYVRSTAVGPLRQGEILTAVVQSVLTLASAGTDAPEIEPIEHPIAIVASQDCDLEQDFRARQDRKPPVLPSVLLYEVILARTLLSSLPGSDVRRPVSNNKNERYHVLQGVPAAMDALDEGLSDLGIDFRRYFTIPTLELYKQLELTTAKRRCLLVSPYLEHFAIRAAVFQCRVALPADHLLDLAVVGKG